MTVEAYFDGTRWTERGRDEVARLWNMKFTASEVAEKVGAPSRNAIIGLINRMGLARHEPRPEVRKPVPNPKIPIVKITPTRVFTAISPPVPLPPAQPELTLEFARPWETRGRRECAWPIEQDDGAIWSCCAPADGEYCAGHAKIMWRGKP